MLSLVVSKLQNTVKIDLVLALTGQLGSVMVGTKTLWLGHFKLQAPVRRLS